MRQFRGLLFLIVAAVFGHKLFPVSAFASPENAFVPETGLQSWVDTTFRFGAPDITDVRDIELFPDGAIAYGGVGRFATIGEASENGTVINPHWRGTWLRQAKSVFVDPRHRAIFGGGTPYLYEPAVWRVADWDDKSWGARGNVQGTAERVLQLQDGDVLAAGRLQVPGDTNRLYGLVRMDSVGAIDLQFAYTNSAGLHVTSAAVTADKRALAGYTTTNEAGVSYGFGRWKTNGERDEDYDRSWRGVWATNGYVTAIEKAPGTNGFVAAVERSGEDGSGQKVTQLVVLDEEGTPTKWLVPSPFIAGEVYAIAFEAVQAETVAGNGYDRVVIGGTFTNWQANNATNLRR